MDVLAGFYYCYFKNNNQGGSNIVDLAPSLEIGDPARLDQNSRHHVLIFPSMQSQSIHIDQPSRREY